jgi:hypothetical protein
MLIPSREDPSSEEELVYRPTHFDAAKVARIKFGKAERENCNAALSVIVERLKREFEISD